MVRSRDKFVPNDQIFLAIFSCIHIKTIIAATREFIYLFIYLFFDFVQSTRYIKQKDISPLQGFST